VPLEKPLYTASKVSGITFLGEPEGDGGGTSCHSECAEHHGDGHNGGHDGEGSNDNKNIGKEAAEAAAKLEESWEGRTFVSAKKFAGHYGRHSSEWSPKLTEEHYVAKARELLSATPDANIEGFVSESGIFIYKYNNATNELAIGMAI